MNSGRSLITLSCIGFVCFPVLLVWAATYINKPRQTNSPTVWLFLRANAASRLTRDASSDLHVRGKFDWMKFQQLGSHSLIPLSLWGMPTGRAFFQKQPTCLNPSAKALKCQDLYFQTHFAVYSSTLHLGDELPEQLGFATHFPRMWLFLLQMSGELKCCD